MSEINIKPVIEIKFKVKIRFILLLLNLMFNIQEFLL